MQSKPRWSTVALPFALTLGIAFTSGILVRRATEFLTERGRVFDALGTQYASAGGQLPDPDLRPSELFAEILRKLHLYYVSELPSDSALAYGAMERMLTELNDPNCRLLSPAEIKFLQATREGRFPGLGMVLTVRRFPRKDGSAEQNITVVSPIKGSPAEAAGLLPGDRLIELDGHWIAPARVSFRERLFFTEQPGLQDGRPLLPEEPVPPLTETPEMKARRLDLVKRWKTATDVGSALELLLASKEGTHIITVLRQDGDKAPKEIKIKVTYGDTTTEPLERKQLSGSAAYVRFAAMSDAAADEFLKLLGQYAANGIDRLAIDLRRCPGGSLDAAHRIASGLIGADPFVTLDERDANRKVVTRIVRMADAKAKLKPIKLVVLVDGGTSGSAEILAAALRDQAGARLLGNKTFGDGTQEELILLENGSGFTLTRAVMKTPKGEPLHNVGLTPDAPLKGDPLLAAAAALK